MFRLGLALPCLYLYDDGTGMTEYDFVHIFGNAFVIFNQELSTIYERIFKDLFAKYVSALKYHIEYRLIIYNKIVQCHTLNNLFQVLTLHKRILRHIQVRVGVIRE